MHNSLRKILLAFNFSWCIIDTLFHSFLLYLQNTKRMTKSYKQYLHEVCHYKMMWHKKVWIGIGFAACKKPRFNTTYIFVSAAKEAEYV